MQFLRKHYSNIIFVILIALLIIPQTRRPIQIFFLRLLAGAPKEIQAADQKKVIDYAWQLATLDDKRVDFSVSAGKVTVVNLWATWCPPCLAEMPSLQNLYNEFGSKVDFYFVSNEDAATLQKFMQKKNYTMPVYMEQSIAPVELQSSSLPTTFVISRSGRIAMRSTGAAKWNSSKVQHLLEKLLAEEIDK